MAMNMETKTARTITHSDAKRFFKTFKSESAYTVQLLVKEYVRKVAAANPRIAKIAPLVELDKAAENISAVKSDYSNFSMLGLVGLLNVPSSTPGQDKWTIQVAERINPVWETTLHVAEGISELTAGVLTGVVVFVADPPVSWALVGPALFTIAYGIVNPIKKISTTRNENLQRLADVIETAINGALELVMPKQLQPA